MNQYNTQESGKLIFLDVDGVLNCEIFYRENHKKHGKFVDQHFSKERVGWLNELCKETGAKVVISSTWRLGRTISEIKDIFEEAGATFEIVGVTPNLRGDGCLRGNEIYQWIQKNVPAPSDFYSYVIIDDDSDMLLWQREHFFQTDGYSGLTPNICYKITRFFNKFN